MPELSVADYAAMDPNTLESQRKALVAKAAGDHENLDIDDLRALAAITAVLRRRASGPPKTAKTRAASKPKNQKASADDLA